MGEGVGEVGDGCAGVVEQEAGGRCWVCIIGVGEQGGRTGSTAGEQGQRDCGCRSEGRVFL